MALPVALHKNCKIASMRRRDKINSSLLLGEILARFVGGMSLSLPLSGEIGVVMVKEGDKELYLQRARVDGDGMAVVASCTKMSFARAGKIF